MRAKRSILGMVVSIVLAAFLTTTAHADSSPPHSPQQSAAARVLTLPAAPPAAARAVLAPQATTPQISPSAKRTEYRAPNTTLTCYSGYLCTFVWDPTASAWKVFFLYYCHTYSVSYWNGWGYYADDQVGSPTSYFLDANSNIVSPPGAFLPSGNTLYLQNWGPVYAVHNC